MELKKQFINQGNFLFKYRSYLPLTLLPVILLAAYFNNIKITDPTWNFLSDLCCYLVFLTGFVIRIFTVGQVPRNTSGRSTKNYIADRLNTTGTYSIVRHPLYLGNFFMWLGIVMYFRSISAIIIFIPVFFLYYERIMCAEEAFLKGKFHQEFELWANKTPAFMPDLRLWKPSDLSFSFTNVLKAEYSGFLGSVVSFVLIRIFRHYYQSGDLNIKSSYIYILLISIFVTTLLRVLRKYTRYLS